MNISDLRIGYWPYKFNANVPGDRRRFLFYAREKKLNYEFAEYTSKYDIVYLTVGCNISRWLKYKKENPNTKIIFECVDSYFLAGGWEVKIRGLVHFLTGKESRFFLSYNKALCKMFEAADAVVCSTEIQKAYISKYNKNVHISLDYFEDDIRDIKKTYSNNGKLKLVWEGQAYTVGNLFYINNALKQIADIAELHVITDPLIVYPFSIFNKKTKDIISRLACTTYLHTWKVDDFSKLITEADLAIIPINKENKLHYNKPQNKLLLLFQMGMPVLTTNTPAYIKVMKDAGLDMLCDSMADWVAKIRSFAAMSPEERAQIVHKSRLYIESTHSREHIVEKWDKLFISVL